MNVLGTLCETVMNAFKTLLYEKNEHVGIITLHRPEALNAFNIQMRDDLYEVLSAVRDDNEIRAAILKGAGEKAFCAGADLSEFLSAPLPVTARQVRFTRDVWGLFLSIPQPLIAALHGYVLGSGVEMALCCDIRIASEDARFGLPEVALGIIPAAGGTQTLPRTVGCSRALEMLLTNRWLNAQEAYQAGLVNRVTSRDKLLFVVEEMAQHIASLDPLTVRCAKEAVLRGMELPLAEGLALERNLVAKLALRKAAGRPKE